MEPPPPGVPAHPHPPGISVWGPPAVGNLGELETPWLTPNPYFVPLKCRLPCAQGRGYGQYLEVLGFRLLLK